MTRSIVYGPGVDLDFGNNKLTNLADGVAADDAATVGQIGGGGAVSSVFTRTGAVTAQTGDYTPAQVGAQPVDSDLTAIAALTTTSFGRSLLELANSAALLSAAGADAAGAAAAAQAASQPLDSDLTAIAALSTTSYGRSLLEAADAAALRTLAGLVIGTNVQAFDATLAALAAANWAANALPIGTGADTLTQTAFAANTFPARASTGNLVATAITDAALTVLDDTTVAAMRTTLGIPAAVGGVEWTSVIKAGDESNASNTTVQADDELFFTPVNGGLYEVELDIIYGSPAGAGTPDLKFAFGEDATVRGVIYALGLTAADALLNVAISAANNATSAAGTAAANRIVYLKGHYLGTATQAGFYWSQNTSGINATLVRAGSILRYRRVS